jgi:hypothetical protein
MYLIDVSSAAYLPTTMTKAFQEVAKCNVYGKLSAGTRHQERYRKP